MFIHCLPSEQIKELVRAPNKHELFVFGVLCQDVNLLSVFAGDGKIIDINLDIFEPSGDGTTPDFDRFEIIDYGQTLKFGNYEASSRTILKLLKLGH